MSREYRLWTPDEDKILLENIHLTYQEISDLVGRPKDSVKSRVKLLRLKGLRVSKQIKINREKDLGLPKGKLGRQGSTMSLRERQKQFEEEE